MPRTFQERGVAVPFTTPILSGRRVREANRPRLELVTRNPAGGHGVYVTPFADTILLCQPTLHDRVFLSRIATLDSITPATIRRAAQAIALEGFAGESAMEAAKAATEADKNFRNVTSHRLLVALIQQVKVVPDATAANLDPGAADLHTMARLTNDWVASHLRQPRAWAATALQAMADVLTSPVRRAGSCA